MSRLASKVSRIELNSDGLVIPDTLENMHRGPVFYVEPKCDPMYLSGVSSHLLNSRGRRQAQQPVLARERQTGDPGEPQQTEPRLGLRRPVLQSGRGGGSRERRVQFRVG